MRKKVIDREVNRRRVAKYHNRKYSEGCKSFTVYLKPVMIEKLAFLRGHYYMTRKNSDLIGMAIETLYRKTLRRINRNS